MHNNISNKVNIVFKNSKGELSYYRNHGRNGVVPILRLIRNTAVSTMLVLFLLIVAGCGRENGEELQLEMIEMGDNQGVFNEMTNTVINDEKELNKLEYANENLANNGDCHADNPEGLLEDYKENNEAYVYVCGNVVNPDVYVLTTEDHINRAIDLAGGFSEDADRNAINLAAKVSDGMKIYVPKIGEDYKNTTILEDDLNSQNNKMTETDNKNGYVNINTASKEELMTLPGIGEGKANKIIEYRENNGPFRQILDICNVSGIKEGAFNKIKERITVG